MRLKRPGILRDSGCQVRRVRATANPESRPVASEISGGAPPYQYSPRKDPDDLPFPLIDVFRGEETSSKRGSEFSLVYGSTLWYLERCACAPPARAHLQQNSPLRRPAGLSRTLFELDRKLRLVADTVKHHNTLIQATDRLRTVALVDPRLPRWHIGVFATGLAADIHSLPFSDRVAHGSQVIGRARGEAHEVCAVPAGEPRRPEVLR